MAELMSRTGIQNQGFWLPICDSFFALHSPPMAEAECRRKDGGSISGVLGSTVEGGLLSYRQGPSRRACWKRGLQSKSFSIPPPKSFGIHSFNSNPPFHVLHHLLPGLLSSNWSIHALHAVIMISLRNKSDHIPPIPSSTLIPSLTLHPLQIKPAFSTAVTLLKFWPVLLYQDPPLSTTPMFRPCWNIFQPKQTPHRISLGKCELKQQRDTTVYLSEWPKSKTLTSPKADKEVEQWQELSFIAGGNAKWYSHFGRHLGSSLQN